MYNTKDYLVRGAAFSNNHLRPGHKAVISLMLYTTNRCNSKCKHCLIWKQKPKVDLSLEAIIHIMNSKCIKSYTTVGLEGGEFLLHPQSFEILKWFDYNHKNYELLSNGLNEFRIIKAVTEHFPKRLYISLDGNETTYNNIRGVNGFKQVIKTIKTVKNKVKISLMYTITPYNKAEDIDFIVDFCRTEDVDLRVGIFGNINYFGIHQEAYGDKGNIYIPEHIREFPENYDFLMLYKNWANGELKFRCLSIFDSYVILPDGSVPLCQTTGKPMGNIHYDSFDYIINSPQSRMLQKMYSEYCNKCWLNFHRKYDVALYRNLEKFLPQKIVRKLVGIDYQWNKKGENYKKIFQNR